MNKKISFVLIVKMEQIKQATGLILQGINLIWVAKFFVWNWQVCYDSLFFCCFIVRKFFKCFSETATYCDDCDHLRAVCCEVDELSFLRMSFRKVSVLEVTVCELAKWPLSKWPFAKRTFCDVPLFPCISPITTFVVFLSLKNIEPNFWT